MLSLIVLYSGSTGFPLGDAYTNRILSIAKGLVKAECRVKLFIIYPGRASGVTSTLGIYDTISYEYLTPQKICNIFFIKKIIGLWGIFHCVFRIISERNNLYAIISFTESSVQNVPIGLAAKSVGIKFIREVNEFPKIVLKKGIKGLRRAELLKIRSSIKIFNGLICISHTLKEYFLNDHSFRKPILVVPITVDRERFSRCELPPEPLISYCGNLYGQKDGVPILIEAFALIADKHKKYMLQLIGSIDNASEYDKLIVLVKRFNLENRIIFTGYIERNLVPAALVKSSLLVLARPDSIQSRGGFPTKLGEYLATGRPVITTATGDIPLYIKHGSNGFLAKAGDSSDFSAQMDHVLSHYDEATRVGLKGAELVEKVFDGSIQAKRICRFITQLSR